MARCYRLGGCPGGRSSELEKKESQGQASGDISLSSSAGTVRNSKTRSRTDGTLRMGKNTRALSDTEAGLLQEKRLFQQEYFRITVGLR